MSTKRVSMHACIQKPKLIFKNNNASTAAGPVLAKVAAAVFGMSAISNNPPCTF